MAVKKKLIAGNWKMNADTGFIKDYLAELKIDNKEAEVILFPPAPYLSALTGGDFKIGGQNCHSEESGAHTGEIAAEMLKDIGCEYVLCGHSERRADQYEDDEIVASKAAAARRAGLKPVICVGENLTTREAGKHTEVVKSQTKHSIPEGLKADEFVLAYEPVWAIGTGKTASIEDIKEMHDALTACLKERFGDKGADIAILYGGSVKPANAAEILGVENVGGVLVGGASLKAADFNEIIKAGNS